jgi:hypothetical protein
MRDLLTKYRFAVQFVLGVVLTLGGKALGLSNNIVVGVLVILTAGWLVFEWKHGSALIPKPRSAKNTQPYASPFSVSFNDSEIVLTLNGKRRESIRWNDLAMVGVRIEQDGFLDTPYWILCGRPGGCIYPHDAVGSREIFTELQKRLPGFDNQAVIQAMGMLTGGAIVWQREHS